MNAEAKLAVSADGRRSHELTQQNPAVGFDDALRRDVVVPGRDLDVSQALDGGIL